MELYSTIFLVEKGLGRDIYHKPTLLNKIFKFLIP
jgi:hypothetical protein